MVAVLEHMTQRGFISRENGSWEINVALECSSKGDLDFRTYGRAHGGTSPFIVRYSQALASAH